MAISPLTQTVEKGRLFFEQAIEIGERFSGIIHVPEDRCEEFEQLAEEAKHRSLRVGSKKTAGYGEIRVINWGRAFGGGGSVWEDEPLSERFRSFQEKCRERGVIGKQEKVFSLTLLSDAIFLDPWFRFRSDLTPKFLAWLTGIELPNAELVHRHIALRRVFGWNQQWHVAVDEQIAVRKGSSYLYIVQDEEDDETWVNRLSQLEAMWLGERTYEGYGRVVVCHPFHLQMEEV
ncbi:hypothetical protein [Geobacillus zalihae]|uniref:hypothetical protein n=1 Tax=Geobacillus zalihae TaxID=213419 RepID=UPI001681087C|nr:hypothetical protein [Geobacillus zalihae]QNU24352.1 hypothetical protein IC806_15270 [Geobacillus zalihae]